MKEFRYQKQVWEPPGDLQAVLNFSDLKKIALLQLILEFAILIIMKFEH